MTDLQHPAQCLNEVHDRALRQAHVLRRQAVDDVWRSARQMARRLTQRLARGTPARLPRFVTATAATPTKA